MSAGFSAILLPQLMSKDTDIEITKEQGSWIGMRIIVKLTKSPIYVISLINIVSFPASMLALPLAFGCIFSGYIMDTLGRKMGQIVSCVPFTIGWIVLATANNIPGRFS